MPLGAVINAVTGNIAQNKQNKANRELAEYSYSKDLEQWNRTNQYNDPSQQMARLKNAGINPNSIYGTSSATGNAGSTTAKYNTPTAQYKRQLDMPNMISMYSTLKNTQANTNLLDAKAITENFNTSLKEAMARKLGLDNQFLNETLDSRIYGQKADDQGKKWTSQFAKYKSSFGKKGISIGQGAEDMLIKELWDGIKGIGSDLGESLFNYSR